MEHHEFTPISPIPVQQRQVHSSFPLSLSVTPSSNGKKTGLHSPSCTIFTYLLISPVYYQILRPIWLPPGLSHLPHMAFDCCQATFLVGPA